MSKLILHTQNVSEWFKHETKHIFNIYLILSIRKMNLEFKIKLKLKTFKKIA